MIIEIDGQRYDVPDDATPDEINALTAPPAPAGNQPSVGQSFGAGVSQGATLNFGDEIEGLIQAGIRRYLERDPDAMEGSFSDVYGRERNYRRQENERAQEANKKAYIGGNVAGGLLTVPVLPGGAAAGGGSKLLQAAKMGAAYGAASGAGRSESVGDMPGTMLTDAAIGAVAGPALQAGGQLLGKGLEAGSRYLKGKAGEVALEQGRKALTGNAGTISVKKMLSPEAVDAAYEVGAIRPGASVKGIAERLGAAREAAGDEYGQIVRALEAAGVKGPNALALGQGLRQEARQISTQSLGSPAPGMYERIGLELQGLKQGMHGISPGVPKIDTSTAALGVVDPRLGLVQAENMKRTLQNAARAEYVKEGGTSLSGEAKMELASRLRQAVEDAIDAQASRAPAEAAAFVPVKQRLGALIEADTAAGTAAAREARKSNFGLGPMVAASGGLASGGVGTAALAGALAKMLQTRGASTVGSAANFLAQRLPTQLGAPAPQAAGAVSADVRAMIEALLSNPRFGLTGATAESDPK